MDQLDKEELSRMSQQLAGVARRLIGVEGRLVAVDDRLTQLNNHAAGLDTRLKAVEQDMAVIKSNYATKADVADAKNSIILWVVGAVLFAQVIPQIIKAFGG